MVSTFLQNKSIKRFVFLQAMSLAGFTLVAVLLKKDLLSFYMFALFSLLYLALFVFCGWKLYARPALFSGFLLIKWPVLLCILYLCVKHTQEWESLVLGLSSQVVFWLLFFLSSSKKE